MRALDPYGLCPKGLWFLRWNLNRATPEIKCVTSKTLVRPIIEYAKIVWGPRTETNCSKLDRIQTCCQVYI